MVSDQSVVQLCPLLPFYTVSSLAGDVFLRKSTSAAQSATIFHLPMLNKSDRLFLILSHDRPRTSKIHSPAANGAASVRKLGVIKADMVIGRARVRPTRARGRKIDGIGCWAYQISGGNGLRYAGGNSLVLEMRRTLNVRIGVGRSGGEADVEAAGEIAASSSSKETKAHEALKTTKNLIIILGLL